MGRDHAGSSGLGLGLGFGFGGGVQSRLPLMLLQLEGLIKIRLDTGQDAPSRALACS